MVISQYNKEFNDFHEDYKTINWIQFYTNIYLLGGPIGEIFKGRRYLIGEFEQADTDFRTWAIKYCMTPEIEQYRKLKRNESATKKAEAQIASIDQLAESNRKRRLKELENKKNLKRWRGGN